MRLLPLLLVFLIAPVVHADFDVHVSPTKVVVLPGGSGEVVLTIVNFGDTAETIDVSVTPSESWIDVQGRVTVAANSSKDLIMTIEPPATAKGEYTKTITFESFSGTKTQELEILVNDIEIRDVLPNDVFRPMDEITLSAKVVNNGDVIDNALFSFEIKDPDGESYYKNEKEIDIGREKTVEMGYQLKPNSKGGRYTIIAKLTKNTTLAKATGSFVIEEAPVVSVEKSFSLGVFSIIQRRTITNLGNEVLDYQYNESIASLGAMFFSSDDYTEDGGVYTWSLELKPLEVKVITYELSYMPIAMLLLAMLSVYTYIRFIYSRVTLKKDFMQTGVSRMGEEIKIMLTIKNKSRDRISTVIVRDQVPAMFRVTRQFGILRPIIRKSETHTNLIYHLRDLGPGEERVFTYAISTVMGLTENYSLPKATAVFEQAGGKKRIYSNAPKIGVKEMEEE